MPPVKIICVTIHSLELGGMERVASELLNYFSISNKFEVHCVMYGARRDIFYSLNDKIHIHQPKFKFKNSLRSLYSLRTLFFLRFKLISINPDIILNFGEIWNNFILISTFGLKKSIYVSDRCQPNKNLGFIHETLRKYLYPQAAGVICQTTIAKEIYSKLYNHNNFIVINNPIKTFFSKSNFPKENVILSVGRLIKSKNFEDLITIFASINPVDWKIVIVGDDSLKQNNKQALINLTRKLGVDTKISFVGSKTNLHYYYNISKIFAFTSISEGFPNVIGEAMSAGLPVISYDCIAGPSELIDNFVTGFLIKLHDKNEFKFYLQMLMNNEDLRNKFGENALKKINNYSIDKIGKIYENLFLNESIAN